jgi:uncharacterized protein (TIGR03790 family)
LSRLLKIALFLLLAWPGAHQALALTPDDLVVVFNRKMPGSQDVAGYYASRRGVPAANLLGVEVSSAEEMSRADFDRALAPPVKEAVERLKARGRTPAVLLVYGLPLRLKEQPQSPAVKAFKELAAARAREYGDLVVQLSGELDRQTGGQDRGDRPSKRRSSGSAPNPLEMAKASVNRAAQYLKDSASGASGEAKRVRVLSLVITLVGTSTEVRSLAARMQKGSPEEREQLQKQELIALNAVMQHSLNEQMFNGVLPDRALQTAALVRFTSGIIGEWQFWEKLRELYDRPQTVAAVDSELTLVLRGRHQLLGWLPNPFYRKYDRLPFIQRVRQNTVMVGRLDGPTPEIAKRLVDDAMQTEKTGLKGTLYIDARGLQGEAKYGNYVWYDRHLVNLYDLVKKSSPVKVVLDQKPGLFPPGSCPDAALYVGWYSLGKYVASCRWQRGAVAYHVASVEAASLKEPGAQLWCKRLLEEGVAATLGPVTEPYLKSVPLPDEFFPLLMMGKLPLLEVYFRTLPSVSWMQILIGDPLYIPFKANPALPPEAVPE